MRWYQDFILLAALWRVKHVAQTGGVVRVLTGIGQDGTDYKDSPTLASELHEGRHGAGQWIQLPDDVNGGLKWWRLRVYLVFMSFDWLANGEFGPFSQSVAARRPCFKCKWTQSCACAFMHAADVRRTHGTGTCEKGSTANVRARPPQGTQRHCPFRLA